MQQERDDEELALVDSTRVAAAAIQGCRHLDPAATTLLDLANRTLALVRQFGTLVVEVPRAWIECLPPHDQREVLRDTAGGPTPLSDLPERAHQLLSLIELGVMDLQRLVASGSPAAVQSLGYALHPIPYLVRRSEEFDAEGYRFCFKIAAFCWSELSPELQQALCEQIGLERERAEVLIQTHGFTIDMYRYGDRE